MDDSDTVDVALGEVPLSAGWSANSYTLGEQRGTVLRAQGDAGELHIPLRSRGVHEVRIGLYRPKWEFASLEVRLTGDRFWREVRPSGFINDPGGGLQDGLLGVFDLTGKDLHVRPAPRNVAAIGYVRLTAGVAPPDFRATRRNVGAVCDVHSILSASRIESADDLRATIVPFADSDFDRICWGTTAGSLRALYFSNETEYLGQDQSEFVNEHTRHAAEVMALFEDLGVDPLRVIVDFAHEIGLELWADDRISHTYPPGTYCDNFANSFFLENQDKMVVTSDGGLSGRMSLAFPEVRDLKLRLLREQASYGIDGIYIDFQRFPGIIGYEPPVVDSFRRETGRNAFDIPSFDREWLNHQARFVTSFMEELRGAIEEEGRRQGRRIPICVQVFNGLQITPDARVVDENLCHGVELSAWVREGLVDAIAPAKSRSYLPLSFDRYRNMVADTHCELWACLGQHDVQLFPDDYHWATYFGDSPDKEIMPIADLDPLRVLRAAADAYHHGVDGVFVWEAGDAHTVLPRWEHLRRLGHREELMCMFGPPMGPFDGRLSIKQQRPVLD